MSEEENRFSAFSTEETTIIGTALAGLAQEVMQGLIPLSNAKLAEDMPTLVGMINEAARYVGPHAPQIEQQTLDNMVAELQAKAGVEAMLGSIFKGLVSE